VRLWPLCEWRATTWFGSASTSAKRVTSRQAGRRSAGCARPASSLPRLGTLRSRALYSSMERHVGEDASGLGGIPRPTFGRHLAPQLTKAVRDASAPRNLPAALPLSRLSGVWVGVIPREPGLSPALIPSDEQSVARRGSKSPLASLAPRRSRGILVHERSLSLGCAATIRA